jgi:hypothetical protein
LVGQNPGSLLQHETLFDVRVGSKAADRTWAGDLSRAASR